MNAMDKVKALVKREAEHRCPACMEAVYSVDAPACYVAVALGREAREAIRALAKRTGRPTWDIEAEARGPRE